MKVTGDSPSDAKITTNQEFDAFRFTNMLPFAQTDTFEDLIWFNDHFNDYCNAIWSERVRNHDAISMTLTWPSGRPENGNSCHFLLIFCMGNVVSYLLWHTPIHGFQEMHGGGEWMLDEHANWRVQDRLNQHREIGISLCSLKALRVSSSLTHWVDLREILQEALFFALASFCLYLSPGNPGSYHYKCVFL